MCKVIIYVEGGVVQGVNSSCSDVEVEVFDKDNYEQETSPLIQRECQRILREYNKLEYNIF